MYIAETGQNVFHIKNHNDKNTYSEPWTAQIFKSLNYNCFTESMVSSLLAELIKLMEKAHELLEQVEEVSLFKQYPL
jgi:hypothetical protein